MKITNVKTDVESQRSISRQGIKIGDKVRGELGKARDVEAANVADKDTEKDNYGNTEKATRQSQESSESETAISEAETNSREKGAESVGEGNATNAGSRKATKKKSRKTKGA